MNRGNKGERGESRCSLVSTRSRGEGEGGTDSVAGCLCSATLYFLFIAVKEGIHDAGSRTFREKGRRRCYKKAQDSPPPPSLLYHTFESKPPIHFKRKKKKENKVKDKFFEQFSQIFIFRLPNFPNLFFFFTYLICTSSLYHVILNKQRMA